MDMSAEAPRRAIVIRWSQYILSVGAAQVVNSGDEFGFVVEGAGVLGSPAAKH